MFFSSQTDVASFVNSVLHYRNKIHFRRPGAEKTWHMSPKISLFSTAVSEPVSEAIENKLLLLTA